MNDKQDQDLRLTGYQTNKLQELLAEMHDCCKERIFYQAHSFDLLVSELKTILLFEDRKYLTCIEIANRLEVAKSRATVIIDGLVNKVLVARAADPNDARVKLISLTATGLKKMLEIDEFIFEIHFKLLNKIDPSQRAGVISAIETLRTAMESMRETYRQ
ncbi:MAG: MarR family winged helix-turn-helix transcriptional regulator [Proteobacteria bacterium]|nr:MarR family winged helix-turn-helix transcriptional regulator [Pseudomonadota bacterium]MBU1708960.1 MarR family winged helix-turn-helix transcriptional regulator [Pseudomonadota bacterium]